MGDHKKDVKKTYSVAKRLLQKDHATQLLWSDTNCVRKYDGFVYIHNAAKMAEEICREHIYVDICHVLNEAGGYIGVITTLDAMTDYVF